MVQDNMTQQDMIQGVVIKKLERHTDARGWLSELFRGDDGSGPKPAMAYLSFTRHGVARGPHEHMEQSDCFMFLGPGDYELYLWDNRKGSETFGRKEVLVVGESNPCSVLVPPGVVHGYLSVSMPGSYSINLPDRLYRGKGKTGPVDEIRYEGRPESGFVISDGESG